MEVGARADGRFELWTDFEGVECGVADEDGGVGALEHGDGVGVARDEGGLDEEELAEENIGVGERAARGFVGGDGADGLERDGGIGCVAANDELDGAHVIERGDGAVWDDGKIGRERCDGDKAEVGAGGEELVGAE